MMAYCLGKRCGAFKGGGFLLADLRQHKATLRKRRLETFAALGQVHGKPDFCRCLSKLGVFVFVLLRSPLFFLFFFVFLNCSESNFFFPLFPLGLGRFIFPLGFFPLVVSRFDVAVDVAALAPFAVSFKLGGIGA